MKKLIVVGFTLMCHPGYSQILVMNDETTDIIFRSNYKGAKLDGTFRGVEGSAKFDPSQLPSSFLKLSFSVASVTANENQFAPDLIQPDCFYPNKYPLIELFSASILKLPENASGYQFNGYLKIKGKSRKLTFPFTAIANAGGYDFNFSFGFLRKAFGINCDAIGKDFKIGVRTFAKRGNL